MSRRGNGLSADAYTPLVDLAPELADTLLLVLGEAGIAAYAAEDEPLPPEAESGLERLYVDAAMESIAENILHAQLAQLREQRAKPGPVATPEPAEDDVPDTGTATAERDEDAIWAELVASFDADPQTGESPWPEQENITPPIDPPGPQDSLDASGVLPTARGVLGPDAPEPLDEEDEGHFVPPPPPPLPVGDPVTRAAWLALIGGPLYLLLTVILHWDVPGWAAFLAVAAFIGGFVALVLRMGDEPRDPDDGAIV